MTRYEQGFMNKCAEYGIGPSFSRRMMTKTALSPANRLKYLFHMLRTSANLYRKAPAMAIPANPNSWGEAPYWTMSNLRRFGRLSETTEKNLNEMVDIGRAATNVMLNSNVLDNPRFMTHPLGVLTEAATTSPNTNYPKVSGLVNITSDGQKAALNLLRAIGYMRGK